MKKDNPKKQFFKGDTSEENTPKPNRNESKSFGKGPKGSVKKRNSNRDNTDKNESFGSPKDSRKGYKKPLSSAKGTFGRKPDWKSDSDSEKVERTVYQGRGKDEKPRFGSVNSRKSSSKNHEPRGFGKKRLTGELDSQERPDYNFDGVPQKKTNKDEEIFRLNKFIANSGICSRREADELIKKGLITVNGEVTMEMGLKVKRSDRVVYQGRKINPEKPVYILLNKPKDFITTTDDPMERKTVMKLVANACEERIFPVGRLDRNTTGLLFFTNDGELAAKLSHPSNEVKKIYQVTLDKPITKNDEEAIIEGLTLEDGPANVDDMQVLSKDRTILGLEIHIGRNRIVRRIFAHLGYEVTALDRVMYAGLDKKDLKRGTYRFLSEKEVIRLKYFS